MSLGSATGLRSRMRSAADDIGRRVLTSNRFFWFTVFAPIFALYAATLRADGSALITDAVSVTGSAWELAHHGTPRIPDGTPVWDAWLIPSGPGHVISNREPGLIGLAAPFYFVIRSASIMDVAPASLAAAVVTAASVATLASLAKRFVSVRAALVVALVIGLGTTTWAVSGTALFPHGPDQLYLALAMVALARGRFAWAGLALAFAIVTRPPLAIVALVAGIWLACDRRSVRPALEIGLTSAVGLAGYLLYSYEFWGGGLQSQYTATGMGGDYSGRFTDVGLHGWGDFFGNIVGTILSPGRGIVFGSPFLIVLVFGMRKAWAVAPVWVRVSAIAGLAYMLIQLKSSRFQGGAPFWSYRYPIEMLTLLVPLLLLAWREHVSRSARLRAGFVALAIVSVAMQAVGAICFRSPQPGGTVVWTFSDLRLSLTDHPVVGGALLLVGYTAAAFAYRRISNAQSQSSSEPPATY